MKEESPHEAVQDCMYSERHDDTMPSVFSQVQVNTLRGLVEMLSFFVMQTCENYFRFT
uniref:Uncharacterized protein n=1 Tax=Stegastes partitus TaxID=144197 RepID=A0A3B5B157_9TELE